MQREGAGNGRTDDGIAVVEGAVDGIVRAALEVGAERALEVLPRGNGLDIVRVAALDPVSQFAHFPASGLPRSSRQRA